MKVSRALRGQRLLWRLYLFEAVLYTTIMLAFGAIGRFIIEPGIRSELRGNLVWAANAILDTSDDPARLRHQIESLRNGTALSASVYSPDGRLMVRGGRECHERLTSLQIHALTQQGSLVVSPEAVAVARMDRERLEAYAIVSVYPHSPPLFYAAIVYSLVLLALALGSVPIARWIARPLERLSAVTQAFGLGDLRARADPNRHDEFGDVARAFNIMADRIETLRRTEKELLANVSHELRTPLARIRVVLELAEDEVPTVAQRYLRDISEDLTQLEHILADVIATAKLDLATENPQYPYPPLRLIPLRVSEFTEAAVAKFQRQHADRVVSQQICCDCTIMADRVMLAHAVGNVLDNAQKYSAAPNPIEFRVRLEQDCVSLIVRDYGIGISAEDLPKLFTPFFRADPSRTRGSGGVGLGLAFAKRLIEAHGGSIGIESKLGEGTQVTLRLPVEPIACGDT